MTESRVFLQPAYILEQRSYRESSLLISAFTRDYGRIALVAKGVKKVKSKTRGVLQPFIPLKISFFGTSELKSLTDAELAEQFRPLGGMALYCGFYVNELLGEFLHPNDPYPELFADYRRCLSAMQDSDNIEAVLRVFELDLLEKAGYGLHLGYDFRHHEAVDPTKTYHLDDDLSPVAASDGLFTGQTLLAIQRRDFYDKAVLIETKRLLRHVLDTLLQGKTLHSRRVLSDIVKRL